ncbi:hypothetical protein CRE_07613 [Caenorhabditis remanei]|uniref:Uncharacterized protein n=1 Tax=Caenorhabditis remanei TaxID=31234 RepID=E3MP86_CAERE|nr:hypothetical protein CRE_07613 [Caenorhabditis remanei]
MENDNITITKISNPFVDSSDEDETSEEQVVKFPSTFSTSEELSIRQSTATRNETSHDVCAKISNGHVSFAKNSSRIFPTPWNSLTDVRAKSIPNTWMTVWIELGKKKETVVAKLGPSEHKKRSIVREVEMDKLGTVDH